MPSANAHLSAKESMDLFLPTAKEHCHTHVVHSGCAAMARTEEQLRRRANNERRRHTAKRMATLKQRFPELPPDLLGRATLRQVSVAVRKMGESQSTLSAFSEADNSSGTDC